MSAEELKNNEVNDSEIQGETEEMKSENGIENNADAENVLEEVVDPEIEIIKKLEEELALTKDALLRKAAELENVRKRVQRERVALYEESKVAALQDFLPISEDILRVVDATKEYEVDPNFKAGMQLVADKFEEVFVKYGVETINKTGIPFDVNLHDAMLKQPSPDKKIESDTVLQVLEAGYKIGNKVIKHAKVIVSE